MAKPRIEEIKARIAARRAERKAEKTQKYRKMRLVAAKAPEKLERHLVGLADKFASAAEGIENLRENLGLVRAAKDAPLKVRVAAAKRYAAAFKRIAEESPEQLKDALVEAYNGLNDIAADIEFAAEQMGVNLAEDAVSGVGEEMESEPKEIAEGEHEVIEEAEEAGIDVPEEVSEHAEEEIEEEGDGFEVDEVKLVKDEPEEEKEAAGGSSAWWTTDRDESGQPKPPQAVDVPRAASSGADPWVTDRDEQGSPRAPQKADIPQVKAQAQTSIKDASKKRAEILQKPEGGTPTPAPAEEFVEKIPQSQGKSEAHGNNVGKSAKATPAGTKAARGSL